MLILAFGIILFFSIYKKRLQSQQLYLSQMKAEHRKQLLENTVSSQEKERKRFASDLHDEVGAMLSFIKLNLGRLEKKEENQELKELAAESKEHLNQVITEVRRITRDLSPPTLEKLGLVAAVNEFLSWVKRSDSLLFSLNVTGKEVRFDPKNEIAVFRIAQELINNAIKHAEATKITIKLKYTSTHIFLSVTDNGKGFDVEKAKTKGLGLKNLESRTEILKGSFKFRSKPKKGATFVLATKI